MKRLNILNKGTQKHKFLTFAERLSSVSVDIFRSGKGADERQVPEGALCYFAEDLDMWADRNLTAEYHQMYIALKPMTMTLPLLLLNLKSVVEILEKCLNETELATPTGASRKDMHNSAIEPTFALVQTLARDARQHLTEFVPRLLRAVLHQIANGSDTDVLEQGFQTVAYLFKYLQRQLLADVTSLYKEYTMYLEHKKPYVREFAAESFSFLIRKLEKSRLDELFRAIFVDLQSHDDNVQSLQDGLVQLFFQSVKGVQTHFNNHVPHIFTTLLAQLQPYNREEDEAALNARRYVIEEVVAEMCDHARAEDSAPVLDCFTTLFTELLTRDLIVHERYACGLLTALTRWITTRRGSRVPDKSVMIALLLRVVTHWPAANKAPALIEETLRAVSALISVTDYNTQHNTALTPLVTLCFNKLAHTPQHAFEFATSLAAKNNFGPLLLEHVLKLVDVAKPPEGTLPFLVSLTRQVNWTMLATHSSHRVSKKRIKDTRHLTRVLGAVIEHYTGKKEDDEQLWNALQVLQVLQDGATHLSGLQTLIAQLLKTPRTDTAVPCLVAAVLQCARKVLETSDQTALRNKWLHHVLAALHKHSQHAGVVQATSEWITAESVALVQQEQQLRTQFTPQLIALLFDNLAQHSATLRRNTLDLLLHLQPCTESYEAALVELCSHVEHSPLTATESKVVVKHIDNVREYLIRRSVNSTERALICSYMLGTLHIRFAPIYAATNQVLVTLAQQDFQQFWELFLHHLQRGFEAQDTYLKQHAVPAAETEDEDEHDDEDDDQPPALENPTSAAEEHVTPFSESVHQGSERSDVLALTTHLDRLWAVLLAMPQIVERHSRMLVPLFLDFYRRYYDASVSGESGSDSGSEGVTQVSDKKLVHGKLCHFLSLFAQFKNAKSVHRASTLLAIYRTLLQRNHIKIQQLALQCLVTWKFEYITPYKEHLERLIDEKSFREELAVLKFGSSEDMQTDGLVLPQHRAALAPLVIDILYPKLTARKARTGKKTLRQKRGAILNFLSLLQRSELEHLFALLLAPFAALQSGAGTVDAIEANKQEGYLNMLEDLVDHFGQALLPFVPQLFVITLRILQHAIESRATVKSDKQALIENLALRRVIALMDQYRTLRTLFDAHRASLSAVFVHELTRWERSLSASGARDPHVPAVLEWCHVLLSSAEEQSQMHVHVVLEVQTVFMPLLTRALLHVHQHAQQEALLQVLEQLLVLRDMHGQWDLITAHIGALLTSLETFIARLTAVKALPRHQARVTSTESNRALTARSLAVIAQLTTLAADFEQSHRIINLLLPFLKPQHRLGEDTTRDILTAIKQLLEKMHADNPHKRNYLQPVAALLERDYPAPLREMLAHVLGALVPRASKLMNGLTAIDRSQLGVPNYEARLQSYTTLADEDSAAPLQEFSYEELLPLMHIALYDLAYSTDLSLRTHALHLLTALLTRTVQHKTHVTVTALLNIVSPAIRRQMNSNNASARGEYLALFVEVIRALPEQYADLVPLLSSDDEANFFYNMTHLQIHRRQRALVRFATYCESGAIKKNVLMNVFYPLIRRTMLETPSTQHHLIDECVKAIAAISKCVDWHAYKRIILTHLALLRTIRAKAKAVQQKKHRAAGQNTAALMSLDKPVIRLIVHVIENFHFDIDTSAEFGEQLPNLEDVQRALAKTDRLLSTQTEASSVQPVSGKQRVLQRGDEDEQPQEEDAPQPEDEDSDEDDESEDEEHVIMEESRASAANDLTRKQRMQHELLNSVLPELYKYLKDEHTREVMRVPVALAIVKLLKLMPLQIFNLQIPKLMTEVCSTLKSRSQLARDQTRATLVQLAAVLGASHFNFIVQELVDALSRGYQVHVLGYTTHSLLKHMIEGNHVSGGEIDYCVPLLMKIMLEDIFGTVAEQKEVGKIAGSMKEAARTQSYDSFKLIGRVINLKQSIGAVLAPLSELVEAATDMEQVKKLQEIFKNLAHGLHANSALHLTDLLVFVHRTIKANLRAYQDQQSKASKYVSTGAIKRGEAKFWIEPEPRKAREESAVTTSNQHLLINFGLQVLVLTVKSSELMQANNVEHLQLLDPFVALLHDTLNSRFDRVLVTTLKTMGYVLKMPLPSWSTRIEAVTARIFSLLEKSNPQSELAQYCFKALTVIIRDQKGHTISDKQLTLLLDHIRTDLSELANQGITFHMLKAIVSRRLLSPQIYDIMHVLSTELLLSSPLPSVRQNSQVIFMQFLLHYPLGDQRLQQHLDLLRQALTHHPYAQARGSVLEMLEQIFTHFPQEVIEGKAEYFYLPLVLALGNESETQQRAMLSHVIKRLLQAITLNRLHALLDVTVEWFSDNTQHSLQRTAALLLGLFVEVNWKSVENILGTVLTRVSAVITEHVQQLQDEDEDEETSGWEQLYSVLLLLEKISAAAPQLLVSSEWRDYWLNLQALLLHPHQWIRTITSRLWGLYFAQRGSKGLQPFSPHSNDLLMRPGLLFHVAQDMCKQMQSQYLTETLAEQVIKNLVFVGLLFYKHPELTAVSRAKHTELAEEDEENDMEDEHVTANQSEKGKKPLPPLEWIFRRLSYMARKEEGHKKRVIFQWFAAMVAQLDDVTPYLISMLNPLYRVVDNKDHAHSASEREMRILGNEVVNMIKKKVGTMPFLKAYEFVRDRVSKVRGERKEKRRIEFVVDPRKAAQRKIRKNEQKKDAKNRKRKWKPTYKESNKQHKKQRTS